MNDNYKHLVSKLNSTRKKFHIYELIRGILLFVLSIILISNILGVVESLFYLSAYVRTILFFIFIIFHLLLAIFLVCVPLLRVLSILKSINDLSLSKIITSRFPTIQDKLINLIELITLHKSSSNDLVKASINQKAKDLEEYDFNKSISGKNILRISYLFLVFLFASFLINYISSGYIIDGIHRVVNYDTVFEKPAPFKFNLITEDLDVKRGNNFILKVNCTGKDIPEMVYVNISGIDYLMEKSEGIFEYELKHVNNSFSFFFTDKTTNSNQYKLNVLPAPVIIDYQVEINYPSYTNLDDEYLNNIGDFEVVYGSKVQLDFKTTDVDFLSIEFDKDSLLAEENSFSYQFFKDENYKISIGNEYFVYDDLLNFNVSVVQDKFPQIKLVQLQDSTDFSRFFFKGSIFDDYGFHQLNFVVRNNQSDSIFELPIVNQLNEQDFYYTFNFKDLIKAGQTAHYYFEVFDNDPFNNYKSTTSESFQFTFPSNEELFDFENQSLNELENLINKSQELSSEIKESIEELKFKNYSGNSSNWEKQQLANELVNKKNQLENIIKQIEEKNKLMNQFMNSFSEEKMEVLEKQKQIEELLQDVLSDELKELFDEFNQLAQDFKKEEFNKMNDKYDLSLDDLSKQLERNLQALKRMKVEQKLERIINFLEDLSKLEYDNSIKLKTAKDFIDAINREKENSISFKQVGEEINQTFELNDELKKPLTFPSFDSDLENISKQFNKTIENLTEKKKNKSINSLQENSKMIGDLAKKLQSELDRNTLKQNFENINNLRQILDNLVYLSLEQEALLTKLNFVGITNPEFNSIVSIQDDLIDQNQHVKDSLYALSNRTPSIGNIVNKELVNLEFSMLSSKEFLVNERVSSARKSQQESITSLNNIALFLNEALKNIEKQMANSMSGDQQCDKPGQEGKARMDMLKQSQQSLKEQLQQMIEQMKSGDGKSISKQLGQTLSQQEIMQKLIRDLLNSGEVGSASKEQLKQIDRLLEQTKVDVINKNITQQTINRQNLILDKLLKAEKSEIERELDKERESKSVENDFYSNPTEFFEYKKKETNFDDQIFRSKYQLKKFYEDKYNKYLNQVNKKD